MIPYQLYETTSAAIYGRCENLFNCPLNDPLTDIIFGVRMTTRDKATGKSERLAVLNSAEQEALYGLPDFDDAQRLEFLALD